MFLAMQTWPSGPVVCAVLVGAICLAAAGPLRAQSEAEAPSSAPDASVRGSQEVPRKAGWTSLAEGLEIARFSTGRKAPAGDSTLVVIRADPKTWSPRLLLGTRDGAEDAYTARQWAEKFDLAVVANAGMFGRDYKTHTGYLRTSSGHVNNANVNHYKSVAAFAPKSNATKPNTRKSNTTTQDTLPHFHIFDLDETPMSAIQARYEGAVQNLRLIKRPGENRWPPKEKRWSEMALAEDKKGRMLFVFSRSPYSMHVFNEILLGLPLGVVAAQHLEGGPEASLFLSPPDDSDPSRGSDSSRESDSPRESSSQMWAGSWETGFMEENGTDEFWPIPNAFGLERRRAQK